MRSRLGLKVLGLCALVVGLMALSAGAAQAEESGGTWTYLPGGVKTELPDKEDVSGVMENGTDGTLLTKIAGVEVEFLCTAFEVTEGKLLKGGTVLGSLKFTGCTTLLKKVVSPPCKPNAEGKESGVVKTLKVLGTLLLHKLGETKDKIIMAEPDSGSNSFAHIEMGEECSIGENVLVGGKLAIIPSNPDTHEATHLIKEFAPLTHLWVISDTAEHKATIDGSALAFLSGANANAPWAATWK